jgi:hypothetical protein
MQQVKHHEPNENSRSQNAGVENTGTAIEDTL